MEASRRQKIETRPNVPLPTTELESEGLSPATTYTTHRLEDVVLAAENVTEGRGRGSKVRKPHISSLDVERSFTSFR